MSSYVSPIQELEGFVDVALVKDEFKHVFLSLGLILVAIRVLRENHVCYLYPVLPQILDPDLMRADIVCPEPLHSKVIDEPMSLQVFHI